MKKQKLSFNKFWLLVLILPLVLSGCLGINIKKKDSAAGNLAYGGLFRTANLGKTWDHVTNLYTIGGQQVNFNATNLTVYAEDPSDPATIYLGTQVNGVYYSYNYGNGWFNTLRDLGTVNSIAVDPRNKCTVYVAVHNSLYKSTDCSRSWDRVYFETKPGQFMTTVAVNGSDNRVIYAGTSDGKFLKSHDYGRSWDTIHRFDQKITFLVAQNHIDGNIVYVNVANKGLFKSVDGAANFQDLMELPIIEPDDPGIEDAASLKSTGYINALYIGIDKSVPDGILFVNNTGLFRLKDSQTWQQVELLSPNRGDVIYAFEVNPQNTNEIFYGTTVAIYHSIDGGKNWDVNPLPTPNSARFFKFSQDNKFMYLGTFFIRQ
ncbi:hypothetical protein HOB10_00360 [Candidatus Parcubacteria bacterium]|nr:hypothetical protein [Candidatus Parcubacteria bacterium]